MFDLLYSLGKGALIALALLLIFFLMWRAHPAIPFLWLAIVLYLVVSSRKRDKKS